MRPFLRLFYTDKVTIYVMVVLFLEISFLVAVLAALLRLAWYLYDSSQNRNISIAGRGVSVIVYAKVVVCIAFLGFVSVVALLLVETL